MKKFLILIGIFIFLMVAVVGSTLFYPQPTISNSPSPVLYNKEYFITKFAEHNIELLNQNTFTITEEELNGYINYQLESGKINFNKSGFKATSLKVRLLDERMILDVYGKLYSLPVRLQADLEPFYRQGKIYFTLKEAKFSRINIPEKYFSRLMEGSIGLNSKLDKTSENDHFILPIEIHEMVIINSMTFEDQRLIIQYELNKEKLLEELLKEFKNKMSP